MDLATSTGNEAASLAWLEDAIEYAHAHGQMTALAYLEAVIEDFVFETEMAERRKVLTVG